MSFVTKYKNQMKAFKEEIRSLGISVTELNKSEPKSRTSYNGISHDRKGVDSDHIKIFKLDSNKSFAFSFNYSKPIEKPFVVVTSKQGKEIISSVKNTEHEFAEKFKKLIASCKELKANNQLTKDTLELTVKEVFIKGQELDLNQVKTESEASIDSKIEELTKPYQEQLTISENLNSKIKIVQAEVSDEYKKYEKELGIPELERKLKLAKNKLQAKVKKLDDKLSLTKLLKERDDVHYDLMKYRGELRRLIIEETDKVVKPLRYELREKLLTKFKLNS